MVFGQDEIANHAAAFANVNLMRPATPVGELVARQSKSSHVGSHLLGHARVGGEEVQQTAMVVLDLFRNLGAAVVARLRPFPTRAGQVAAKRRRVEIPFLVGQWVMLAEPAQVHVVADFLTGGDEAGNQFVGLWVVIRRRLDRQPIVGRAEAETKTIGHHARCRIARFAGFAFAYQRQQPAGRIALDDIRVERKVAIPHTLTAPHAAICPRLPVIDSRLVFFGVVNAVVGLAVSGVALAHHRVADSGGRQQVAFVGRVEKHLRPHRATLCGRQLRDARAFLLHRRQTCLAQDSDPGFLDQLFEHALRDMRLDRIRPTSRRTAFALEGLGPVQGLAVAGDEPREIFAGDSADAARLADVHRAQSTGSHPPEMPSRLNQYHALPHPRRLHRRDNPT